MMHFRLFAILLLLVAGSTTVVSGQTQQEPTLDMEFTDIPLSEAISRIEKNTRYTFFYDAKQTDLSRRVSLKAKRMPISDALKEMLAPTGLNFTITERQIALIPARKTPARQRTVTGVVNDSSETPLAGVAVTLVGDNTRGAVTEANGGFTLTVPDADITLSFTYLGSRAPSPRWTKNSCRTARHPRWPTCCKAPFRASRSRPRRDVRATRPPSTSAASPRSTAARRWCWSTEPKAT